MANVFGGTEIVEMGIQIEKNGKDFYETLVAQSKNERAKKIYKHLAGEEEKHIAAFKNILDSVQKYEPPEAYTGEYFAYMSALAGEYVFTMEGEGKKIAQKTKSDNEALDLGIGFEKDSILFYTEMKKAVPKSDHHLLNALISQEQDHLKRLVKLKKEL